MTKKRTYLPTSPTCFVCGEKNHAGLQGTFYVEDDAVFMPLNVKDHHCGYPDVVHGGIVAAAAGASAGPATGAATASGSQGSTFSTAPNSGWSM